MNSRRLVRWGFAAVGITAMLLSVLGSIIYGLVATETGSRWLASRVLPHLAPSVTWGSFEGTIKDGLRLTDVQFSSQDTQIKIGRVSGKWHLLTALGGHFIVDQLQAEDLDIVANGDKPSPREAPQKNPWPRLGLPLPVDVGQLSIARIRLHSGDSETRIQAIRFSGRLGIFGNRIEELAVMLPDEAFIVSGELGSQPPYKLNLQLSWHGKLDEANRLAGRGTLRGNLAKINLQLQLSEPFEVTATGTIDTGFKIDDAAIDPATINAELSSQWRIDRWPAPGIEKNITSSGQLTLSGPLTGYQLNSHFGLAVGEVPNLPPQSIDLSARGDLKQLLIEQLSIDSDAAAIRADGTVSWEGPPSWNLRVAGKRIDPGYLSADWQGQINANLEVAGSSTGSGLTSQVNIHQMTGTLRGYPINLAGQLAYDNGRLSARELRLTQGDNRLQLDASYDRDLQANWTLQANDLAAFYPGLKGRLQSQGWLAGSLQRPRINADLTADSLSYSGFSVASGAAHLATDTENQQHLTINLTDANRGFERPVTLDLQLDGDLQGHRYQLTARQQEGNLHLAGIGHWDQARWQTDLAAADLNYGALGHWSLSAPTQAIARQGGMTLKPTCWRSDAGQVCADIDYKAGSTVAIKAHASGLQLALIEPWLPENTGIAGAANANLQLSGTAKNPRGTFDLTAASGELILNRQSAKPERIDFRDLNLDGLLDDQTLQLQADIKLLETGQAQFSLAMPVRQANAPLNGKLTAQFSDLVWLDPFLADVSDLGGRADVDLILGGTANRPQMTGYARFTNLAAFVPRLGVHFKNGDLNLEQREPDTWNLTGRLESGEGYLQLDGTVTLNDFTDWRARLAVTGQQLQTLGLETLTASISPDLTIDANADELTVKGKIEIPSADINLRQPTPSAVEVSRDQVIVDSSGRETIGAPKTAVNADIDLALGEKIAFKGFGVNGHIRGNLRLRDYPQKPLRMDGTVKIHDGIYEIYGQKLTIDRGRLIFQGPPDDPLVDIRASRKIEDQLVGIQISGKPDNLSSDLFSSPSLPPTETMSLLVTGKPLAGATETDANTLMNAATALGINRSEGLVQRLRSAFGVDVLSVSSDSGVEQSAVTIGKYLTPKLFMSYMQDIFTPNSTVNLEYSLTDKLKIKAKSGTDQGMDILYNFEHE